MKQSGFIQPQKISSSTFTPVGILQRKCACGQHTVAGGECETCRQKRLALQRSPRSVEEKRPGNEAPSIVHDVLRSPGQALDRATRAFMEPRFGHDFSNVRVHTDARAAESARAVNALAYTVGRDVVFGAGQYALEKKEGKWLLAHELVHVVQQGGATGGIQAKLPISVVGNVNEREAENTVDALMHNQSFTLSKPGKPEIARQMEETLVSSPTSESPMPRVPQRVKVWVNSFIPPRQISGPPGSECFRGDDRGPSNFIHASSRSHQEIEFDVATLSKTIDWKHMGTTHEVNCTTGGAVGAATAPISQLRNGRVVRSGSNIQVDFQAEAKNPLVALAPAIDLEAVFIINPTTRQCSLSINHDGFPAYEAYVTADGGAGIQVHSYDPRPAEEGIRALYPPMDKTFIRGPVTF